MKKGLAAFVFASLVAVSASAVVPAAPAGQQPGPNALATDTAVIRWQVELSGGVKARLMAQPGEMVQVTRPDGTTIGMLPRVEKSTGASPSVTFEIYEVFGDPRKEKQTFRRLDTIEAHVDELSVSPRVADLNLTLKAVERARPETAPPAKERPKEEGRHIVRWAVVLADGRWIKMAAVEGDTAFLRLADGRAYGLQPSVGGNGRVTFAILGAEQTKAIGTAPAHPLLERFTVGPGADYFPVALADSLIQISDVRDIPQTELGKLQLAGSKDEVDGACCVTCGQTRACACGVSMDCGDCCVPPCCAYAF